MNFPITATTATTAAAAVPVIEAVNAVCGWLEMRERRMELKARYAAEVKVTRLQLEGLARKTEQNIAYLNAQCADNADARQRAGNIASELLSTATATLQLLADLPDGLAGDQEATSSRAALIALATQLAGDAVSVVRSSFPTTPLATIA